jgi:hypothetical protein
MQTTEHEPIKPTSRARLHGAAQHGLRAARTAPPIVGAALLGFWRMARPIVRGVLQVLLALIIVFEQWGWEPLANLLGRSVRWQPWARAESAIARLPPYAALFVFILPTTLLLPLKFLAIFLVAEGHFLLAAILFMGAKVVATALVARLFMLTQPGLMQIGWFAWTYDAVMPWKEALVERVHASWVWRVARVWKERVKRQTLSGWRRYGPSPVTLSGIAMRMRESGRRTVRQLRARWAALR